MATTNNDLKGLILEGNPEMDIGSGENFFNQPITKGIGLNKDLKEVLGPILEAFKFKDIGSGFDVNKSISANVETKPKNKGTMNLFSK